MPKFMTYQRPTPVTKQNWNHAPDRKAPPPIKGKGQNPAAPASMPPLEQLIRKR